MKHKLSEKWIKASITGTIWAASEIVLGSFLHNLNIPFSGNILTAIGIIILISISYIWTDKGLFWRAGLICAIMKTMSPSAVIFGPMIAIFSESLLLELSVRLLGRTIPAYVIGAMLAMSWNLFQKIGSYIIYYGSGIVEVYTSLLKMAQKQLNIQTDLVWLPIIILLIVYALFGLFSAVVGIRVGRKMLRQPVYDFGKMEGNEPLKEIFHDSGYGFGYSVVWLFINIVLIITSFFLLSHTPWYIWSAAIPGIVLVWSLRYKRALRQLSKPKFWIFFVAITLLTAFVFTKIQNSEDFLLQGFLTGIQMNFRAVVIITGFSTLGTELYNPVVRNFFVRTSFKDLPLAIELSADSLPGFIAAIPNLKSLISNPVSIFYNVISHAGRRLEEIKKKNRRIFIISGSKAEGKTTYVKNLIGSLGSKKIKTGGILAERVMNGTETIGYDIIKIGTGEKECFLTQSEGKGAGKIGKFTICQEGLLKGKMVLKGLSTAKDMIIIIDEIGLLELNAGGWSENLDELIKKSVNHLILVVRDEFVDRVKARWDLMGAVVVNIHETDFRKAEMIIMDQIN